MNGFDLSCSMDMSKIVKPKENSAYAPISIYILLAQHSLVVEMWYDGHETRRGKWQVRDVELRKPLGLNQVV